MKTVLIVNGSCRKGQETIEKLLSENNLVKNTINNEVICIDKPENVYALEEFLAFDEFTFIPAQSGAPIDLNKKVDLCFVAQDKEN